MNPFVRLIVNALIYSSLCDIYPSRLLCASYISISVKQVKGTHRTLLHLRPIVLAALPLACKFCPLKFEKRRTSRHTGMRARLYNVVMGSGQRIVSKVAKASTLVSELILRRAKAKGSVVSVFISYLTAHADVYPASLTSRCMAAE